MNELIWIEVIKDNLIQNIQTIREVIGEKTILAACVKGNAYGHGLVPIANIFVENGVNWLCINSIEEAEQLRKAGVKVPLLILGYVQEGDLEKVFLQDVRIFVYNKDTLNILSRLSQVHKKTAIVHLKIDTGMSRQGILPNDIVSFLSNIITLPGIIVEGIATHFATADNGKEDIMFHKQLQVFELIKKEVAIAFPTKTFLFHASNSAAILIHPEAKYDLVRPGSALYGYYPSQIVELISKQSNIFLKPALRLKSKIAQIKTVPKGSCVSYGCTFITKRRTKLALVPVGYADGLKRDLSNDWEVIIGGRRSEVCGRICMGMFLVDITHIPNIKLEDEVIILGETNTVSVMKQKLDSVEGEILTGLRESIRRYYI